MILTIFIVFISFVSLIIIHEFGHFILAKKFGIKVEEFGIGFPPRLFGKKIGETIYSLNLLPLGGFVKIYGEDGGIEDYRSFAGKPVWQRYLIILGGVIAFWIIAIIILSVVAGGWGMPVSITDETELNNNLVNPRVQVLRVSSDTLAQKADIRAGDVMVGFNKVKDFQEFIRENQGEEISLNIARGNQILEKQILAAPAVRIVGLFSDTPAEIYGLMQGDIILNFNSTSAFQEFIKNNQNQEISLDIKRGEEILSKDIAIKESLGVKIQDDLGGISLVRVATETYPWYSAPWQGIKNTGHYTANIVYGWIVMGGWVLGLSELPEGIEEEDMSVMGPVGIFVMLGEFFQMGPDAFLRLVALIAVALAMINILPIPALDGGRMAFLTVEAIRGKPINYKIEQKINTAFFVLLISLIIFITVRFDIPGLLNS